MQLYCQSNNNCVCGSEVCVHILKMKESRECFSVWEKGVWVLKREKESSLCTNACIVLIGVCLYCFLLNFKNFRETPDSEIKLRDTFSAW